MSYKKVIKCQSELVECLVNTPIGQMVIKGCQNGLHQLSQVEEIDDSNFIPHSECNIEVIGTDPINSLSASQPVILCIRWLKKYFEEPHLSDTFKPSLCLPEFSKTSYQQKVWITLSRDVKAGETVSYSRLAEMTNNPKAARAVGTAMMSNPFLLIVPCHRVIKNDGTIGLFSHGRRQKVKQWLLEHEKIC